MDKLNYGIMISALGEAERANNLADQQSIQLAKLLLGRLRSVGLHSYAGTNLLRKLKKELSEFNANTGMWKS